MSGTKVKLFLTINLLFSCKCLDVGSPVELPVLLNKYRLLSLLSSLMTHELQNQNYAGAYHISCEVFVGKLNKEANFNQF